MRSEILAPVGPQTTGMVRGHGGRLVLRGLIGASAIAALAVGMAGTAAAQEATPPQAVDGNVEVLSAIALTGLSPSFVLTGLPNTTAAQNGAVVFNVETNNLAGYAVTVQAAADRLAADTVGNANFIPIGALSVRETGTTPFTPLSNATAVTVHTQATRSAEDGDSLSNDYSVDIPFVNEDNYDVAINYIATAN